MAIYNSTAYQMYGPNERVWVKLAALRDAMAQFPHAEWFWYLDQVNPFPLVAVDVIVVCDHNEPFHSITYTLPFTSKSPRSSSPRCPCLSSRNYRSHTTPSRATHLINWPYPQSRWRNSSYRVNYPSSWRLWQVHTGQLE